MKQIQTGSSLIAVCLFALVEPGIASAAQQPNDSADNAADRIAEEKRGNQQVAHIAVLEFVDKGPSVELAPLRIALAELLTGDLSRYKGVRAVERVRVNQFLKETSLGKSGLVDAGTAQRAGQALAADYLLSGAFSGKDTTVTLDVVLIKIGEPEPVAKWKLTEAEANLFKLEQELVAKTLAAIRIKNPELVSPPTALNAPSPPVAVISFRNFGRSAELDTMETGFADILQADLSALENVQLVERDKLLAILDEQRLTVASLTAPETATKVGQLIGAKRYIYGSFIEINGRLRMHARLADTQTASVLASEMEEGPANEFASMIESLALRLTAHLAVQAPENARELVKGATSVRSLEAAIYVSRANQQHRRQEFDKAIENYDRALLIEPRSVDLRYRLIRALYFRNLERNHDGQRERLTEIAMETLKMPFAHSQRDSKYHVYGYLVNTLFYLGDSQQQDAYAKQWAAEFKGTSTKTHIRSLQLLSLQMQNRRGEAIAMLDAELIKAKASGDSDSYGSQLVEAMQFFSKQRQLNRAPRNRTERTRRDAARIIALVDELLALIKKRGKKDRLLAFWGRSIMSTAGINVMYIDNDNRNQLYLSAKQKAEYTRRLADAVGDSNKNDPVLSNAAFELATASERDEKWVEALGNYQEFLKYYAPKHEGVPSVYEFSSSQPNSWIDQRLEARFRIAEILHRRLEKKQEAIDAYQTALQTDGLTTFRGPEIVRGLYELNTEPKFAEKAVLVWGGASNTVRSWRKVLEPVGFKVHIVRRSHLSATDLAPYKLVILNHSGNTQMYPCGVLGLRSYVATGGSLLAIVSPAYEAAAPGIDNAALSFFNVHAGQEGLDRAECNDLADHPITEGVAAVTARHAVVLETLPSAAVVKSEDRTVLAAIKYRAGRVVVASFGQWLLPDPTIFGNEARWKWRLSPGRAGGHVTARLPLSKRPIEPYRDANKRLLDNTIKWLTSPQDNEEEIRTRRQTFAPVWLASLQAEAQAVPRESQFAPMDRLIDSTPEGIWKEEALMLAGESSLRMVFFPHKDHLRNMSYGFPTATGPLDPQPRYYSHLSEQFPSSSLRPLAQWRLGDCEKLIIYNNTRRPANEATKRLSDDLSKLYEQVEADKGSLTWAWKQLRLGEFHYKQRAWKEAIPHFRDVTEQMDAGMEKTIAMLNLGSCYANSDQRPAARRIYEAASALPNINWKKGAWTEEWRPPGFGNTRQRVSRELKKLGTN